MTKKKKTKKIKILIPIIIIILVIIAALLFLLLSLRNENNKKVYEVTSRTKELAEAKKNNNEYGYALGWLRIIDTPIDLPILNLTATDDNQENAYVNFKNYAWNVGRSEEFTNKLGIVGHNIRNLSSNPEVDLDYFERFDDLMSFVYLNYAKEHEYIQYTIGDTTKVYKIYSVYFVEQVNNEYYETENVSQKALQKVVNYQRKKSIFDYKVDVDGTDKIMSLITCTRFFGEDSQKETFVVAAREVRPDEELKEYGVTTNDNYKEVEKQMKGSEKNEEA